MKKKILKLHNDWASSELRKKLNSYGGCGYYRTVKIAQQLSPEYEVTMWGREWHDLYEEMKKEYVDAEMTNEYFFSKIFKEYDIVWFHHMENPITLAWMRVAATKYGKKLVMDMDDNYLELDNGNPAKKKINGGQYKKGKKGFTAKKETQQMANLSAILSCVDAITVSTFPLKNKIQEHISEVHGIEKPVFVVPNYNDVNDWNHEKVKDNGTIIGYVGGLSHNDDLDMVLPALKEIMIKYPHVRLQLMGQMDLKTAKKIFGKWEQDIRQRIILMNATQTQPEYPYHLSQQPWSIGIAPLIDSPFNESKSHIKWMEYSMYKIPVVASKVYPYYKDVGGISTIEHGETGLLCENHDDWVKSLSLLIENEGLRKKLGQNAYNFVSSNWQYKDNRDKILKVVEKIIKL